MHSRITGPPPTPQLPTTDSAPTTRGPGGGDGNLDITTGKFTSLTPGYYTVAYSGHANLNAGQSVDIFLYHNGESIGKEGQWISSSDTDDAIETRDQGSKSLVSV